VELGSGVVDDDFFLLDDEAKLDDLRLLPGRLLVRMHERRRDQLHLLARKLELVGERRHCGNEGG
jgi:hypothetical protein